MGNPAKTLRSIRVLKTQLIQSELIDAKKASQADTSPEQHTYRKEILTSLAVKIKEAQQPSRHTSQNKPYRKAAQVSLLD
ncbi:hypothetical protein [uncultured Neptuniibacter sp.]|uniref:hypothetical protein n=1 Tax=uncultured Neptuniibacter sp. TaxID=502143 RepID=UPI00261AFDDF|nr:hypothetical protein [uncultured Neptuniibacter sp.]